MHFLRDSNAFVPFSRQRFLPSCSRTLRYIEYIINGESEILLKPYMDVRSLTILKRGTIRRKKAIKASL